MTLVSSIIKWSRYYFLCHSSTIASDLQEWETEAVDIDMGGLGKLKWYFKTVETNISVKKDLKVTLLNSIVFSCRFSRGFNAGSSWRSWWFTLSSGQTYLCVFHCQRKFSGRKTQVSPRNLSKHDLRPILSCRTRNPKSLRTLNCVKNLKILLFEAFLSKFALVCAEKKNQIFMYSGKWKLRSFE